MNNRRMDNTEETEAATQREQTIRQLCQAISEILGGFDLDSPCLISISGVRDNGVDSRTIAHPGHQTDIPAEQNKRGKFLDLITRTCASHLVVSQECAMEMAQIYEIHREAFFQTFDRLISERDSH